MADDVPAATCRTAPSFVFQVPPAAADHTRGATAVIAAAGLIGASGPQSATLGYLATFVVSLVPLLRASYPDLLDGDFSRLDACLRRSAGLARSGAGAVRPDLASDMRRLRDVARDSHPVLSILWVRAEERARVARAAVVDGAGALRRWAEATWSEHGDAINSASFFVHLVAAVVNAAGTALISAAYEAASARAPAVLSHLRGFIKEIRSQEGAASYPGFLKYRDMAPLVQTAAFLALVMDLFGHTNALAGSPLPVWVPCLVALCFTAVMVEGNRGGPARTTEHEVPESWRFLWFVMIVAYCVDACLLRLSLGPEPLEVAFLALCHVKVIGVGKKVQRAPQDQCVNGGADRWRRTATALLAASVAKVAAIGVVLNVQLAALSLVALCVTAVLLVMREENLSDLDASGGDIGGEVEGAGFAADTIEGAVEETGQVRAEQSSRGEHDEELRHEESDHSSMDGWAFVEVDPADVDQSCSIVH